MRDWWLALSRPRRLFVTAVAALVVAGTATTAVLVLGSGPSQDGPVPVLLVPGYGGSRSALSTLADELRRAGRDARVVPLPGDGTGDLNAQARALDDAAGDAGSVDVVGYSAGGVVARLWVNGPGADRVRRVVTLGSPLHGTDLAAEGGVIAPGACPVACQQLSPGSALLTAADRRPVAVPWLSIWTENDQTVRPPDSARLAGAVNVSVQELCARAVVAHSELPTSPLVTRVVLAALSGRAMTAPVAGC
ncbi:esterase/lipase family protein [Actinophytocola sp.]|uniref:esterase/lipase family protein n=1 Tax=Actinophytocola sp. TaxID=1872138 RepID=UPI00389B1678